MSGRGEFTWGSNELRRWLADGGASERWSPLLSRWRATAFDLTLGLQRALPASVNRGEPPIFVIGFWRSGTTLLHELVSALPGMSAPTTSQCLRPASFRLVPQTDRGRAVVRPMDDVQISVSSPQEDEFALLLLGEPSLYRGLLDPRRLPELQSLLVDTGSTSWLDTWKPFIRDVASLQPGRLIVKSPNHLFRLQSVLASYPDSPLLISLRDPVELYHSNVRTWNALIQLHGLWQPPGGAVEAFVAKAMEEGARAFERVLTARNQGQRIAICQFSELVRYPVATVRRMAEIASIPSSSSVMSNLERPPVNNRLSPRTVSAAVPEVARRGVAAMAEITARMLSISA